MDSSDQKPVNVPQDMAAVLPPFVRSGANALNRALFTRTLNLAAATLDDVKKISMYRQSLFKSNELLKLDRYPAVVAHPDKDLAGQGRKCLLLNQGIKIEGRWLLRPGSRPLKN